MNKKAVGILFIVTCTLSLIIGYKVCSQRSQKIESGEDLVAQYSYKGNRVGVRLKELAPFLTTDQSDYKKIVYNSRRQAIESLISNKVREGEDLTRIDFQPAGPAEIEEMAKKMKLDPRKMTEKQRSDIAANLTIGKRNEAIKKKLETSVQAMQLDLLLQPPFDFVNDPESKGVSIYQKGKKSEFEMTWFGNLHCPQCGSTFQKINETIQQAPEKFKINFVYHGQDPDASIAFQTAKAIYCLKSSNSASPFIDTIGKAIQSPPQDADSILKVFAGDNPAKEKELATCLGDRAKNAELRQDAAVSANIPGAQQTASFLVLEHYFVPGSELKDLYQSLVSFVLRSENKKFVGFEF